LTCFEKSCSLIPLCCTAPFTESSFPLWVNSGIRLVMFVPTKVYRNTLSSTILPWISRSSEEFFSFLKLKVVNVFSADRFSCGERSFLHPAVNSNSVTNNSWHKFFDVFVLIISRFILDQMELIYRC